MKGITVILCCITVATALAIPTPEQASSLQVEAQVVIGKMPFGARPGPEPEAAEPETALIERDDSQALETFSESCFCAGGAVCCQKDGATDCSFGVCGI